MELILWNKLFLNQQSRLYLLADCHTRAQAPLKSQEDPIIARQGVRAK